MKAIAYDRYGPADVLRLDDVPMPAPRAGEVLVRVVAAAANAGDWHLLRGDPFLVRLMFGLFRPKHRILGSDVAGRVEAVGADVAGLRAGDEVFGDVSQHGFGGYAEFVAAPAAAFVPKPANLTFEEAAAIPVSGQTALQALRDAGRLQSGEAVLVNGASGGVGTFAVQLGKALGATVTGVCSTRNLDLVRGLGADDVVDYTRHDVTRGDRCFDLVIDTAAFASPLRFRRILRPGGRYVLVGGATARMFQILLLGPLLPLAGRRRMRAMLCRPSRDDLLQLGRLAEQGKLRPAIERRYALAEVPEAIRHLETGRARGKVVITVAGTH